MSPSAESSSCWTANRLPDLVRRAAVEHLQERNTVLGRVLLWLGLGQQVLGEELVGSSLDFAFLGRDSLVAFDAGLSLGLDGLVACSTRSPAFALACTAKIPAAPPTSASMTDAVSAATAGLLLHQSHARSAEPTRRAAIGRESSQQRRSSANACADVYRLRGSFARHFRQIVSRSRGRFTLRLRGDSGGRSFTACRVLARLSPPKGALAVKEGVEDRAQAIHIGRRRDRPATSCRLLRRHVCRRAENRATGRHLDVGLDPAWLRPKSVT